jgi:hypothetical protein
MEGEEGMERGEDVRLTSCMAGGSNEFFFSFFFPSPSPSFSAANSHALGCRASVDKRWATWWVEHLVLGGMAFGATTKTFCPYNWKGCRENS